ncbi:polyketide synthase [Aspergillus luchuensis]|uniref:Polyketide synthase n=1 Tax=Aspergillus kawachii TaxID=1069201 RepID=A0A146FY13_ASPKA|nr:polyketide synthase [Aspergillus luchuensis]
MSIYKQPVRSRRPGHVSVPRKQDRFLEDQERLQDEPPIITHDLSSKGKQMAVSEAGGKGIDRFEWSLDRPWAD